jgi:hypothetical protein
MYGGAALPGRFGERDVTILDSYEAVGAVVGTGDPEQFEESRPGREVYRLGDRQGIHRAGRVERRLGQRPANTRSPVHVVVIPSGREGDQTAGSLEVKALWGRGDLVRSVNLTRCSSGTSGSRSAMPRCTSTAQRTASTTLANSANRP